MLSLFAEVKFMGSQHQLNIITETISFCAQYFRCLHYTENILSRDKHPHPRQAKSTRFSWVSRAQWFVVGGARMTSARR